MNKAKDITNVYEIPRVILAPVSDEIQLDENLEPPFVRPRETNSQIIVINVQNNNYTESPCDQIIPLVRAVPRVNRIKSTFLSLRYLSPNINPLNNRFSFVKGGVPFTATIPFDQNLTGLTRYQALALAMSVATGIPGDFAAAVHPVYANTFEIRNTIGAFWRFDLTPTGTGIINGRFLWGFNGLNYAPGVENSSQFLCSYTESYTRWIDILSYELTQFTKIDISGVNVPAECFIRYQLNSTDYGSYEFAPLDNTGSLNFNRSKSLSSVDIQVRDEFGNLLYIPQICWSSFVLNLTFLAQL